MKILLIIFILIVVICIISIYLFSFSAYRKQERFVDTMKQKKTWIIIVGIMIAPIILYSVMTIILIIIRGDDFPAYHVYSEEEDYIYYEDNYYVSITDDKEKCDLVDERVQGNWIEHGYVRGEKMQFPYLHYWIPGYFLEDLLVSEDEEYLFTRIWAGSTTFNNMYQRVEEQ